MYGTPRDCKGEVRKKKVSLPQMYPASSWRFFSGP
jgi:hypothetical protein